MAPLPTPIFTPMLAGDSDNIFVPIHLFQPVWQALEYAEKRLQLFTREECGPTQITLVPVAGYPAIWRRVYALAAVYLAHNVEDLERFCQLEEYKYMIGVRDSFQPEVRLETAEKPYFFAALLTCLASFWSYQLRDRLKDLFDAKEELAWLDTQIQKASLELRALRFGPLQNSHIDRPTWREMVEENEERVNELKALRSSWIESAHNVNLLLIQGYKLINKMISDIITADKLDWWIYSTWSNCDAEITRITEQVTSLSGYFDHIAVLSLVEANTTDTPLY